MSIADAWEYAPAPPVPATPWTRWRCSGLVKAAENGKFVQCSQILGEFSFGPGSRARIRCPKCQAWNIIDTVAVPVSGDTERQ